jgi:DNA-binding transcriptional LysR family regulator
MWREPVVVALPGTHALARRAVVDVSDLATELFVIAPAEDAVAFHDQVFALCRKAGFSPRVASGVPDIQAAIALVAAGHGMSPVPAAIQSLKLKGVVYRPLRPQTLRIEMGLAWRRDDESALVRQFTRVAREAARRSLG